MNINNKLIHMRKGSGMLVVFFLLTILIIVSAFGFYQVSTDIKQNARYVFEEKAFWLAESGISFAEFALRNEELDSWTDVGGDKYFTKSTSVGDFDVYILGLDNGIEGDESISAYGYVPSKSVTNKYVKNIVVNFYESSRLFEVALFSQNNLLIKNNVIIDSYNSDDGSYGGANVLHNGSVAAQASSISLHDDVVVYGDIHKLEKTNVKILHNSSYTGEIIVFEELTQEEEEVPDSLALVPSAGPVSMSGSDSITLSTGSYAYSKLDLDTDAEIIINGDVKIRIDNSLNMNDNSKIKVNGNLTIYTENGLSLDDNSYIKSIVADEYEKPANVVVFGPGNSASSDFSGNSEFYGVMYAPGATISFNDNAQLFGAVASRVINFSQNSQLHYDELLGTEGVGSNYERLTWHEV